MGINARLHKAPPKPPSIDILTPYSSFQVEGVGPTGLRGIRFPCMYVARACLFDRAHNRFIGNVMGFKPQSVLGNDSEWVFDQKVGQHWERHHCESCDKLKSF